MMNSYSCDESEHNYQETNENHKATLTKTKRKKVTRRLKRSPWTVKVSKQPSKCLIFQKLL